MPSRNKEVIKRFRYLFAGVVQGVGFRPFIYRLAVRNNLRGFVQNRPEGVLAEIEGTADAVESFLSQVREQLPPQAQITHVSAAEMAARSDDQFRIIDSAADGAGNVHIPPEIAVCENCLQELFDPADRRYRYPFINCTDCGPRLTIIRAIPYDRSNTSMACFPLCPQCRAEYENPADRRFHAEPNACPQCGPEISILASDGTLIKPADPLGVAVRLLRDGKILAIKGLGGFHLSVDAANDEALRRLRSRKFREEKPLAVMVGDLADARKVGLVNAEEERMLASPQRPIVLLQKKEGGMISSLVAPRVPNIGVMLPYTPLHYLLLKNNFTALVMTSANQVDEPICIGNREAVKRLAGVADYFLIHNRDILVRCDDSIVMAAGERRQLLRRSRGFVPLPVELKESFPAVLALGPQLKVTQCIVKGNFAFLSAHLGDMETPQARDFFHASLSLLKKITETDPGIIACDYHPDYYSTRVAEKLNGVKVVRVQHHHAHIAGCLAENGVSGNVIGIAMDGTGFGLDGHAWGGEFLVANQREFRRRGHLKYFALPGGEKAIHEPWRIAAGLLQSAYGASWISVAGRLGMDMDKSKNELLDKIIAGRINTPLTSGLGRLFDGVAALIGLRSRVSFEGQAAMELEAAAAETEGGEPLPFEVACDKDGGLILDMAPAVRAMVDAIMRGTERSRIASSFHVTLTDAFVATAKQIRKQTGINRTALSGGCFQNRLLLLLTITGLESAGFDVYYHKQVPANDGGVALGQAVVAGSLMK